MKINKNPLDIWQEYQNGVQYNTDIGLYDTVQENEDFFIGDQWKGCNAPDLQKPVFNILKRCVTYFISTIASNDIGVQFQAFDDSEEVESLMKVFSRDVERVFEKDHTKSKLRTIIRNSAVDGDGCLYFYWDDTIKTGKKYTGDIRSEIVNNINLIAGNPYEADIQRQPYLIVALRKPLDEVIDEAKANGIKDADNITTDEDAHQGEASSHNNDLVTVVIKMWKSKGQVHAIKVTKDTVVRPEWNTECSLYPVAWMRWDNVRNSYHGQSAVTGLIPNQIAINKLMAMYLKSVEALAFPKIVYDVTKFGNHGWSNRVGEAIGIAGDVGTAAVNVLKGGDVSYQVMDVVNQCVSLTKDCIGANDAALGAVNVDRAAASAIIAAQQASAAPLELQRREFYDFCEQCVLIIVDFMGNYYGEREAKVEVTGEAKIDQNTGMSLGSDSTFETALVDYSRLKEIVDDIEVNVGDSAYWSELAQQQTLDSLLQNGIITDIVDYLSAVPEKWLPNKQKLIESAKKAQEAQANAQGQEQQFDGGMYDMNYDMNYDTLPQDENIFNMAKPSQKGTEQQ